MSIVQWLGIVLGIALAAVALVPVSVTRIERRQAVAVRDMVPYPASRAPADSKIAVVYYSRSGNTALAARHLAQRLNAQHFELQAREYALGLAGWARAMKDARGHATDIMPRTIDLSSFDTIYLGSPVWLYRPAPPIWAFVESNRFDGKRVVLFNTFNSHFGPGYIEAFRARVMARGARTFEHRHVLRGRMTQQITPELMLEAIDTEWLADDDANSPTD